MAKKVKQSVSRKERTENFISKWAFCILFALAIELIIYVFVLNIIPTMVNKTIISEEDENSVKYNTLSLIDENSNNAAVLNSVYKTDRYYTSNGVFMNTIDNPTWLIYYYNMFLLVASILLILYYLVNLMEHSDRNTKTRIKTFLMQEWPFAVLLFFMLWVFISSLLAGDSYRSFIGCYNLKDGYFSFLMYGSMLVCSILLLKDNKRYKDIIINTFLITATFLAIITLWNYYYLISDKSDPALYYYAKNNSSKLTGAYLITYGEDSSKTAFTIGELLFGNGGLERGKNFLIVTKRVLGENNSGVFHNSNHYGYYLSICVVVASVMALKSKKWWQTILYYLAYGIMLYMAIINNTFGAYLGIGFSLIFMLIYTFIPKCKKGESVSKEKRISYIRELCFATVLIITFITLSFVTVNKDGKYIVYENFSGIISDAKLLFNKDDSNTILDEGAKEANAVSEETNDVEQIGSGRGILWLRGMQLALQRPLFGWGLENIIYQYSEQFDIGEGRSHNLIVQLSATTGIVGMLLYVVGIISIWIRRLKYIKTWDLYECLGMFVIVSYMISSLVGNSSFYASPYFYIFVGFVVLSRKSNDNK